MKTLTLLIALLLVPSALAINIELLNTNPAPILAGDYADVTIRVEKEANDGPAQEVVLGIEETGFITPISEMGRRLTNFRSGDTITHTFRLFFSEDLAEGFIDLPVLVQFDGGTIREEFRIFVQEAESDPELYVGEVKTIPNELLPDTDNNKLHVVLQNLGDKDADLLRAELQIDHEGVTPSYSYSFVDSVSSIPSGDERTLEFTIDLDETTRETIPATIALRYRVEQDVGDNYETYSSRIPFDLPIVQAPFLQIVNVTFIDSFQAGSTENRVRVTIRNSGEEDAEEVRVRALPDISYPFIFELTTEYVASKIEPGETAQVEFSMEVVRDAQAREYPTTVRLESLVGETRYSQDDTMMLVAREGKKLSVGSAGMLIIAAAILLSLYLGYRTLRKRKK